MKTQRFVDCTSYVVSFISVLGSLLLLIEWFRRPGLRGRVLLRPLMYEVASQFVRSIGLLVETSPLVFGREPIGQESPTVCSMLGALDQFSGVACYGWYTAIAFNAALALRASVERPAFTQPEKRERVVRVEEKVVWLTALLAAVPTALQGMFDPEQGYGAIEETGFLRYDCWITSSTKPQLGQTLNFLSFLCACLMGIALLRLVFLNRHRVSCFNSTFQHTVTFTGLFLTLWVLQHVSDFAQYMGQSGHSELRKGVWANLNEALKGVGGLVCFFTWYPSRTLQTSQATHSGGGGGDGPGGSSGTEDSGGSQRQWRGEGFDYAYASDNPELRDLETAYEACPPDRECWANDDDDDQGESSAAMSDTASICSSNNNPNASLITTGENLKDLLMVHDVHHDDDENEDDPAENSNGARVLQAAACEPKESYMAT